MHRRRMVDGLAWEAKKGVASCDKPRGGACSLRSVDARMESNPSGLPQGVPKSPVRGTQTLGKETSEYQEEEKPIEIPLVAASESGRAQTESARVTVRRCGVRVQRLQP